MIIKPKFGRSDFIRMVGQLEAALGDAIGDGTPIPLNVRLTGSIRPDTLGGLSSTERRASATTVGEFETSGTIVAAGIGSLSEKPVTFANIRGSVVRVPAYRNLWEPGVWRHQGKGDDWAIDMALVRKVCGYKHRFGEWPAQDEVSQYSVLWDVDLWDWPIDKPLAEKLTDMGGFSAELNTIERALSFYENPSSDSAKSAVMQFLVAVGRPPTSHEEASRGFPDRLIIPPLGIDIPYDVYVDSEGPSKIAISRQWCRVVEDRTRHKGGGPGQHQTCISTKHVFGEKAATIVCRPGSSRDNEPPKKSLEPWISRAMALAKLPYDRMTPLISVESALGFLLPARDVSRLATLFENTLAGRGLPDNTTLWHAPKYGGLVLEMGTRQYGIPLLDETSFAGWLCVNNRLPTPRQMAKLMASKDSRDANRSDRSR